MRDVVITGVGLLSALGADADAHWNRLQGCPLEPAVDRRLAPYLIHPLGEVDFTRQVPKKSDLRQMEPWQRIGVFAAGLALTDAGIAGASEILERTNLIVAAGSGERDTVTDTKVLEAIAARGHGEIQANEILPSNLRPTLFLAQLSNLLAGNISIVHKVTGSSRTFMGEESAGYAAVETAARRIEAGQGDVFLVGGAFNAERPDILLNFALGNMLLEGEFAPVWQRTTGRGGIVPASVGAFLVLESREHASQRGAKIHAMLADARSDRSRRGVGDAYASLEALFERIGGSSDARALGILSGASGVAAATREELAFLDRLVEVGAASCYRAYGSVLGHGVEAHFPLGIGLAALSLRHRRFYSAFEPLERDIAIPPREILVTGVGHWRGEAMALVKAVEST